MASKWQNNTPSILSNHSILKYKYYILKISYLSEINLHALIRQSEMSKPFLPKIKKKKKMQNTMVPIRTVKRFLNRLLYPNENVYVQKMSINNNKSKYEWSSYLCPGK